MNTQHNGGNTSRRASVLWAVVMPFVSFGAAAAVMSIPPDTQGVDLKAGRDLFRAHCGSCHFAKVGFPAHHGPNLHQIGRTGAERRPDLTAAEYILESVLEPSAFVAPGSRPGMPNNVAAELAPEDIRNIVGFLASCDASPDFGNIKQLVIPDRRTTSSRSISVGREQMALAQQVLRDKGKCLECHSLHANPDDRIIAPALFGVGMTDRQQVHNSLLQPDHDIKPQYACVSVELTDGMTLSGQLLFRGADHLVLCLRGEQGQLVRRRVAFDEVATEDGHMLIHAAATSLMPTGFDKLLTAEEIEAVEVLIHQLN